MLNMIVVVKMKKTFFAQPYFWLFFCWCLCAAYGIHGNSGYLLRFDPRNPVLEVVERITSEPSKRCWMFDQFSYGYLGFELGPDGHTRTDLVRILNPFRNR